MIEFLILWLASLLMILTVRNAVFDMKDAKGGFTMTFLMVYLGLLIIIGGLFPKHYNEIIMLVGAVIMYLSSMWSCIVLNGKVRVFGKWYDLIGTSISDGFIKTVYSMDGKFNVSALHTNLKKLNDEIEAN